MPHFTLPIENQGPLLNVQLSVSAARSAALVADGQPVPNPFVARGLVDTGASCTSIDPAVVNALGIAPTGTAQMVTPSTGPDPVSLEQYDIGLAIYALATQSPIRLPVLAVVKAQLDNQGFHVLIGRDVLAHCVLVYNGSDGQYTLSF